MDEDVAREGSWASRCSPLPPDDKQLNNWRLHTNKQATLRVCTTAPVHTSATAFHSGLSEQRRAVSTTFRALGKLYTTMSIARDATE
jgi:hypothetical protein